VSRITLGKITNVENIGPMMGSAAHGFVVSKSLIVLHETVSSDIAGWSDVMNVAHYLDEKDYGMHGIIDYEANIAWSKRLGRAIFYHATSGRGLVNTKGIGIELISRVMLQSYSNYQRWLIWWKREAQLRAAGKLCAWISRVHGIPLVDSDSSFPGVTTHWEVTKRWNVYGGHTDCWPKHKGGYFPKLRVLRYAKTYKALGY